MKRLPPRPPKEESWNSYKRRLRTDQIAVIKPMFEAMAAYAEAHGLPWTPVKREGWLAYQRDGPRGSLNAAVIDIYSRKPSEFGVKLPWDPEVMGLENPYPNLRWRWDEEHWQWLWAVPTLKDLPDVSLAIDITREFLTEREDMVHTPRPVRKRLRS